MSKKFESNLKKDRVQGIFDEPAGIDGMTNEELVSLIKDGSILSSEAYNQLFLNLKPAILIAAHMYKGKMVTYDMDDFLQEGFILIWKTLKNFKGGNYKKYFISAMHFRLSKLYENYVLKNPICISQSESCNGYTISLFAESEKAKSYREKKNARQKRYAEKKRAEKEAECASTSQVRPTAEEQAAKAQNAAERHKKANLAYYSKHKDELNRKRREKRAAAKNARLAVGGTSLIGAVPADTAKPDVFLTDAPLGDLFYSLNRVESF